MAKKAIKKKGRKKKRSRSGIYLGGLICVFGTISLVLGYFQITNNYGSINFFSKSLQFLNGQGKLPSRKSPTDNELDASDDNYSSDGEASPSGKIFQKSYRTPEKPNRKQKQPYPRYQFPPYTQLHSIDPLEQSPIRNLSHSLHLSLARNGIDYASYLRRAWIMLRASHLRTFNVFIPFYGRGRMFEMSLAYLTAAALHFNERNPEILIHIIYIEIGPDFDPDIRAAILDHPCNNKHKRPHLIDYYYVPDSDYEFPKALAYNLAFLIASPATWNIFHDLDILVPRDFFFSFVPLLNTYPFNPSPDPVRSRTDPQVANLSAGMPDQHVWGRSLFRHKFRHLMWNRQIFSYQARHISKSDAQCSTEYYGQGVVNDLSTWKYAYSWGSYATGGSIIVSYNAVIRIGGYDPEFFVGWGPEDLFMIQKLEHINHELTWGEPPLAGESVGSFRTAAFHVAHRKASFNNDTNNQLLKFVYDFQDMSAQQKATFCSIKEYHFTKYVHALHLLPISNYSSLSLKVSPSIKSAHLWEQFIKYESMLMKTEFKPKTIVPVFSSATPKQLFIDLARAFSQRLITFPFVVSFQINARDYQATGQGFDVYFATSGGKEKPVRHLGIRFQIRDDIFPFGTSQEGVPLSPIHPFVDIRCNTFRPQECDNCYGWDEERKVERITLTPAFQRSIDLFQKDLINLSVAITQNEFLISVNSEMRYLFAHRIAISNYACNFAHSCDHRSMSEIILAPIQSQDTVVVNKFLLNKL